MATDGKKMELGDASSAEHELVNRALKHLIVPRTPEDPGAYLDEYRSTPSSPGVITFQLQIDRPAVIYYILYSFSPLGAATLQIGDRMIPIPSTTVKPPDTFDVAMIVKPTDIITLTAVGATTMFIEVMGKILSGTEWSQV